MKKILFLVALLPFLILGCGSSGGSTNVGEQQHKPAAIVQAPGQVYAQSEVRLADGGSFDSDGDLSSYQWYDQNGNQLSTDSNGNAVWTAPEQEGEYTLQLEVSDSLGNDSIAEAPINVVDSNHLKNLIKSGEATYICVGDSTRAIDVSGYDGGHVFETVKGALSVYGVKSLLFAKHGYTARNFNNEKVGVVWFDWNEIKNSIPNDGATTIVDITLGINDIRYYNDHNISNDLSKAILKIRNEKPKTNFLLTMPNKIVSQKAHFEEKSKLISKAYFKVSQDLGLPIIDVMGELFSGYYDDSMYRSADGVDYANETGSDTRIHLSRKGQSAVAELILDRLLP